MSGSSDQTPRIWDVETGECKQTLNGHTDYVRCCAVSRLGTWVLSGSRDNTLKIWDVDTGECKKTLNGHTSMVTCCAVSRLGKWVYSTSGNETIVWDAVTGTEALFLPAIGENFSSLAVGADGFFAVGSSTGHCYMAQAEGLLSLGDKGEGVARVPKMAAHSHTPEEEENVKTPPPGNKVKPSSSFCILL